MTRHKLICFLAAAFMCLAPAGCGRHKSASSPLADGVAALCEGRLDDAAAKLRKAVREQPGNARILTTLGVIGLKSNRVHDAEAFLLQALQADAKYPAALYDLAFIEYKWLARPDEAKKKYFETFVSLSDDAKRTACARQALANIGAARGTAPTMRTCDRSIHFGTADG